MRSRVPEIVSPLDEFSPFEVLRDCLDLGNVIWSFVHFLIWACPWAKYWTIVESISLKVLHHFISDIHGRPCSSPTIFSWNTCFLSGPISVEDLCVLMGGPSSTLVVLPGACESCHIRSVSIRSRLFQIHAEAISTVSRSLLMVACLMRGATQIAFKNFTVDCATKPRQPFSISSHCPQFGSSGHGTLRLSSRGPTHCWTLSALWAQPVLPSAVRPTISILIEPIQLLCGPQTASCRHAAVFLLSLLLLPLLLWTGCWASA